MGAWKALSGAGGSGELAHSCCSTGLKHCKHTTAMCRAAPSPSAGALPTYLHRPPLQITVPPASPTPLACQNTGYTPRVLQAWRWFHSKAQTLRWFHSKAQPLPCLASGPLASSSHHIQDGPGSRHVLCLDLPRLRLRQLALAPLGPKLLHQPAWAVRQDPRGGMIR